MLTIDPQGCATLESWTRFQPGLVHGCSTRKLGTMSCRIGEVTNDAVVANRRRFLHLLGCDIASLVVGQQQHTTNVRIVEAHHRGCGAYSRETAFAHTDALVTGDTGVVLAIIAADCAPVLLYDPVKHVVAAAHAGWRGAVGRIVYRTTKVMVEAFGCIPGNIHAAIGPCIGPQHYEVGQEVIDATKEHFPQVWEQLLVFRPSYAKPCFDLPATIAYQLGEAGILPHQQTIAHVCTLQHHEHFFSYRGEGEQSGRFMAVIGMKHH